MDRAGYYYKILQLGPEQAYEIINTEKHPIINFIEEDK